jgi:hypothetical protein
MIFRYEYLSKEGVKCTLWTDSKKYLEEVQNENRETLREPDKDARTLANLGVDTTADVFIPANKGAGSYTFCTHCFHQGFEQIGDEAIKICKNPAVDTGIATAQCYWKNPRTRCCAEVLWLLWRRRRCTTG